MDLQKLTNEVLENNFVELFQKERTLLCVIILYVMEVERRKLYLDSKSSLFEYLQNISKYSHGTAQRRVSAAMLALEIPEILKPIRDGRLNDSQIVIAQKAFRQAAKEKKLKVSRESKLQVLKAIAGKTVVESEIIICTRLDIKPKTKTKLKRQGDGSVRGEMTFSKEEWVLMERVKELLSHSVPSGDLKELIVYMATRVIAHKDKTILKSSAKASTKSGAKPLNPSTKISDGIESREIKIPDGNSDSKVNATSETPKCPRPTQFVQQYYREQRSRRSAARKPIPAAVEREVFARDKCCQHKNPLTGEVCGSRWQLQVDLIQPIWAGGSNEISNLRLMCGAHNRAGYKRQAGVRYKGDGSVYWPCS